ncbi:MAG: hypothetical protein HZA67_00590 [Rhodospirillales bacterium]|jgi:hypothetical protein|nr:hypothetical protein [Rhodospirillales bacterium]MDK9720745.1 hypothetical protein [Rhodospirillales bacterium]
MLDVETKELLAKLKEVEGALEARLEAKRAEFKYHLERGKVVFETEVIEGHKRLRTNLLLFLRNSRFIPLVTSPIIYSLVVPFALLDITVAVYQAICFTIWGIKRVKRSDYVVIDRHRLAYLNAVEKLSCVYCGYVNGLIALVSEVASRTEQYWCPIKHASRVRNPHARYSRFVDYGDAEGYRARLDELREEVRNS